MSSGPGFEIRNCTQWPMTVSLDQLGPLYWELVQPGGTFVRDTGAVWFTISAAVTPENRCRIDTMDAILPVASVVGAILVSALTGGWGAFWAVADSIGAAGFMAGGAVTSLANVVVEGAIWGGATSTLTVGTATGVLGKIFSKNGGVKSYGCYAGAPWPFNGDRKQYSIVGGPVASAAADGKLQLSEGTPLQVVEGFRPFWQWPAKPAKHVPSWHPHWIEHPRSVVGLAMIRHGYMFGIGVPSPPTSRNELKVWDGGGWASAGTSAINLELLEAAADGTLVTQGDVTQGGVGDVMFWHDGVGTAQHVPISPPFSKKFSVQSATTYFVLDGGVTRYEDGVAIPLAGSDGLGAQYISVAADGTLAVIDGQRNVRVWRGSGNWQVLDGVSAGQVIVAGSDKIWAVTYPDGWAVRWVGDEWQTVATPEPLYELAASSDGAVCVRGASGRIYSLAPDTTA